MADQAPGAQTQPVDGDWVTRLSNFTKRLGVGPASGIESMMHMVGVAPSDFMDQPVPGKPGADYVSDKSADFVPQLRAAAGTPPPTNFEERLPEEIGSTLANIPFAGAGRIAQGINVALGIGAPEALHGVQNLISPAQAAPTDADLTKPAPVEKPAVDTPAPYAPRLDGTAPQSDDNGGLTKPSDWLGSVENDGRYWAGAGAIAATALGALALMKYNASSAASLATRVGELTSNSSTPTVTSLASALNGGVLDRNAPVKDFFATLDPANKDLFNASVDTKLNNAAVNQKIASFMQTGEYPGTGVSGTAPVDFFTSVAKRASEVDPGVAQVEQHLGWEPSGSGVKQFDNYLLAANELDIRRAAEAKWLTNKYANTGVMPAARTGTENEIRPNLWDKSTSELEQYVRAGDANPVFSALRDQHKGMMQDMSEYMFQKGLINSQDLAEFRGAYPNYSPIMQRADDPLLTKIKTAMMPKFDVLKWDNQEALLDRSLTDHGGISGRPGDGQFSALGSTDQYMQSMMKFAETNDIRKEFLNKALSWQAGQTGEKVFQRTSSTANDMSDVIMFKDGGNDVHVKISDPAIRGALEANSIIASPLWNAARGVLQQTVTGALAPWFSIANVIHMASRGAMLREPGTAFGYGDKLANMMGYKGGQLDPTAVVTGSVDGVIRNLYGHTLQGFSSGLRQSIENDGMLSKLFGSNAQAVSDATSDAFLRTTLHAMQSQGVGHGGVLGNIGEGDTLSSLAKLAPAYSGNPLGIKSLYNLYDSVISSVRNGAEAHYFAMNNRSTATDAEKVINAGLTRDLGGDPAKRGSADLVNKATAALPYLNVTMQGNAKIARMFGKNPGAALTGVISTVGIPAVVVTSMLANLSPQERDEYYKLTPEVRTGYVVLPFPGVSSENWPRIPVAPELRGMFAAGMTMLDHIYGLSSNVIDHQDHRDIKDSLSTLVENQHAGDMWTALKSQFFSGLPSPVTAGLAAMGMNAPNTLGENAQGISGQRLDNIDPTPTKYPDDAVSAVREKLITAVFGQLGQIGVQSARAFHYAAQGTGSAIEGVKAAASAGLDEVARRVPEVSGMLWGVGQRLSPHNADGDLLSHKMEAMKNLDRADSVQIGQGGSTTPAGQALLVNHGGMQDVDVGQVLQATKAFQQSTLKGIMDQRANAYSQMSAINGASSISMPNKGTLSNGYVRTIEELNRAGLDAIHEFETQMTATHPLLAQRMGGKITLEQLVGQK